MHLDAKTETHSADTAAQTREMAITHFAIKLAASLSQLDGRASSEAYWAMREVLPVGQADEVKLRRLWLRALDAPVAPTQVGRLLKVTCHMQRELCLALLERLCVVARAEGEISPAKRAFLLRLGRGMKLSPWAVRRVIRHYVAESTPHAVLGVDAGMSQEKLRAFYRSAARALHPDAYAAYGASKNTVHYMTGRLAEVNAAYRAILKADAAQAIAA